MKKTTTVTPITSTFAKIGSIPMSVDADTGETVKVGRLDSNGGIRYEMVPAEYDRHLKNRN